MYSKGEAILFLGKVFGDYKLDGPQKNIAFYCPNCKDESKNKRKLSIKLDNFVFNCWKCGIRGKNIYWLLKKYHPSFCNEFQDNFIDSDVLDFEYIDNKEKTFGLPHGFELLIELINSNDKEIQQAISYLRSRGLVEKDFWYFKFGIARQDEDFKHRIVIPSFDEGGNLNYFTSRKFTKTKGIKYLNCNVEKTTIVFNELNIDWHNELTLVEGTFDLMKVNQNATCLLGSLLDRNHFLFQKIIKNKTPICLCLDNDAQKKQYKIAELLLKYDINVKMIELPKTVNDIGECSKEQFKLLYNNAKKIDINTILKNKIENIE